MNQDNTRKDSNQTPTNPSLGQPMIEPILEPKDGALDVDQERMRLSGALESGYHSPTEEDLEDLKKSHRTSSGAGAVNIDELIRAEGSDDSSASDKSDEESEETETDKSEELGQDPDPESYRDEDGKPKLEREIA